MKELLYSLVNLLFGIDIPKLIAKNKTLETERDSLLRKLDYSESKVLKRDKELALITTEQKELADKHKALNTNHTRLQARLEETEKQNDTLKHEAKLWQKKWQESEKELSSKIDKLMKEKERVENELKVLAESKLELSNHIDKLTAETTLLKESYNNANSINKTFEDENSKLKSAANDQTKRIKELAKSLEETNNKNSALQKEIEKLHDEITGLKAEGNKAETDILNEPKDGYKPTVETEKRQAREKVAKEHENGKTIELDEPKKINKKVEKDSVEEDSTTIANEKKSTKSTIVKTTTTSTKNKVESTTLKPTTQKLPDGTLIEHNSINVGQRAASEYKPEEAIFDYSGKFLFDMKKRNQPDAKNFPHVFYPKVETSLLKFHKSSSNVTSGVTEPLLIKALEKLTQLVPEIEIHQNTSLSINNRNYSYRPDIALVWEKHNIFIDVEVDEPYDIVSREPIHYYNSGDYLRNLYFISQGWVVIRFSEEQVYKTALHCVAYIASILKEITKESVFDELIATHELDEQERWSFDKAKELAAEKYRESYLNIEAIEEFEEASADAIDSTPFAGVTPAMDILPKNEEHIAYEQIINSKAKEYIRVTIWPLEYQRIYSDYKIETKNYRHSLIGYNVVEEKYDSVVFDAIMKIEPLDSPFKYPLLEQHNFNDFKKKDIDSILKIKELIFEAIYNFNPISIKYKDSQGNITQRNITYIGYERDSREHFADNIWTNYYTNYSYKDDAASRKIVAYCELKNKQRTFFDGNIQAIQVYNLRDTGLGHYKSFTAALWYPIKENDMELAHHIAGIMPQFVKDMMDVDVVLAGNYAHYLLLTGKTDQAIDIYKYHDGKQVTDDMDWKQMNLTDFETLKDIADYNEKFEMAKRLLGWN